MNNKRDDIYAAPQLDIAGFRFDKAVASVFPDMIKRSVPGYETIIAMTGTLAERYVQPNSRCYDLGCSLGASTVAMRHHIQYSGCEIVAVDNSEDMLNRCRAILQNDDANIAAESIPVELVCGNIQDIPITNASMVVVNFTLQFIPVEQRAELLHHDFKRANGYSDLEISQKRSALENVLIPETLSTHQQRLSNAGFSRSECWFQCFNFASLIALK